MTKEREMGQRAQKGVDESTRPKGKSKGESARIGSGELSGEATETLGGGKKVEGRGKNNGSPEAKQSAQSKLGQDVSRSFNGHQAQQNNRPRCRCWCCCCSCSCLALKNNEPKKETTESDPVCDGEPLPSLEEVRSWSESFDNLMKCPGGRKVFRDFLKCEYSEENILFWLACEELKKESRPEALEEKARVIYEDYISILSPKEVSLDSRVREIVNQNMVDPNPHTFDEAQVQIYTLMHRDSYPRFVNSSMYKKLAQLNTMHTQSSGQEHRSSSVSATNTASRKQSIAT